MPRLWRYAPADNRTPKIHPILGYLAWDQTYENPLCAADPDFVEVDVAGAAETAEPASKPAANVAAAAAGSIDANPAAERPDANRR